jgi:hypothetical protein
MAEINYTKILAEAFALRGTPERVSGCGRVYVCLSPEGGLFPTAEQEAQHKKDVAGIKKAAKALGKIYQTNGHGGLRKCLYVGYDNASGLELGRGTAIVAFLKANGIGCYRDENGD